MPLPVPGPPAPITVAHPVLSDHLCAEWDEAGDRRGSRARLPYGGVSTLTPSSAHLPRAVDVGRSHPSTCGFQGAVLLSSGCHWLLGKPQGW